MSLSPEGQTWLRSVMLRDTTRLHPGPPYCPGVVVVGVPVVMTVVGASVVGAVVVKSLTGGPGGPCGPVGPGGP